MANEQEKSKVYVLATMTLKDAADADKVVELVKSGVETTSSKNESFIRDRVFKSVDGKTIVNYSEWTGGLETMQANHQKNEQNPDYKKQIAEVEKYATFAPMVYTLVFEHEAG